MTNQNNGAGSSATGSSSNIVKSLESNYSISRKLIDSFVDEIIIPRLIRKSSRKMSDILMESDNELSKMLDTGLRNIADKNRIGSPIKEIKTDSINLSDDDFKKYASVNKEKNLKKLEKLKETMSKRMNEFSKSNKDNINKQFEQIINEQTRYAKEDLSKWYLDNSDYMLNEKYNQLPLDQKLKRNLENNFMNVVSKIRTEYNNKGKKLSVSRYINSMNTNEKRIFQIKKQTKTKLRVLLVMDQSGSMSGSVNEIARLLKTLKKSVKNYPNIIIEVLGFEGSNFRFMDKDNEFSYMLLCGGSTPTCKALALGFNHLQKFHNEKRLMILISDGMPNPICGSEQTTNEFLKYLVDSNQKNGIDSYGLLVGQNIESFSKIFGSKFEYHDMISEANQSISNIFKKYVSEFLC